MIRKEKAEKRHLVTSTLKPIQDKLRDLEERIDGLEKRKAELERILADPEIFKDKNKGVPLLNEYGEVRKALEGLIARWEYKQQELEAARKDLEIVEGQ